LRTLQIGWLPFIPTMAAKDDSDSEASSSSSSTSSTSSTSASSSSDDSSVQANHSKVQTADDADGTTYETTKTNEIPAGDTNNDRTGQGDDAFKAFLSRIPQTFDDVSIKRIVEEKFGENCVVDVSILYERLDDDGEARGRESNHDDAENNTKQRGKKSMEQRHRGFAFVTFSTLEQCQRAIEEGTVRGSAKPTSKRRHTLYIRPVVRDEENDVEVSTSNEHDVEGGNKNICFLWKKFRCPYGDDCKFSHEGEGGCANHDAEGKSKAEDGSAKSSGQKCFAFKKRGKCKLGDKCPFSHDLERSKSTATDGEPSKQQRQTVSKNGDIDARQASDRSQKDCINWKNKGKCRKGDKCPFRHDKSIREKILSKKNKTGTSSIEEQEPKKNKRKREEKNRQSLSIRVFGLNYSTTEEDVREFFQECGIITEITFPTFEDSGRSKGYCGILFASPKAVQKAVGKNGTELHGRWLSVQEGKMFLRKWEEAENERKAGGDQNGGGGDVDGKVGEFGQKVKKRKRHGFKE